MLNHSAKEREEAPHLTDPTENVNQTISLAVKRRAQSLINDRSIDAQSRAMIRYGLEINDPWLPELVRLVDAGQTITDTFDFSGTPNSETDLDQGKVEALTEIICRAGNEPATKSVALLVLLSTLENSTHPKALANIAKHFAFTSCSELNIDGMVDAQIEVLEADLLGDSALAY